MKTARMALGALGENAACEYLVNHGHTIVERNWRRGHYELDIVTLNEEGIHFVEVKSRVAPVSAAPEDNVGFRKQTKLVTAAQMYLRSKEKKENFGDLDLFFDIVSVIFEGDNVNIVFFPKAFIPFYC